jgi:aminoglycoside phosphotransferase (APT) family kinase protein
VKIRENAIRPPFHPVPSVTEAATPSAADAASLRDRVAALLSDVGLAPEGTVLDVRPLTGGVSSDIARVDFGDRTVCVKFALPRLRVTADWRAPVGRSRAEYAWLRAAWEVAPGAVPRVLGYSDRLLGFAMEYLGDPDTRLWKAELLAGRVDPAEGARVGDVVGRIHRAGAAPGFDRAPFANAGDFHALRVEPYLLATARVHPDLEPRLSALARALDTAGSRPGATLVHGDVSPKNILIRPEGPVILDAECATMGDAAFDLAFCLNHLALKSIHLPAVRPALADTAARLWSAYRPHVGWEDPAALEARIAALLPALMLARVDGKSPVEYLSASAKDTVRAIARPVIADPPATIRALFARLGAPHGASA